MLERHGFKQFEETVPAKQADAQCVQRIHETGVTIEVIDLLVESNEHFHGMKERLGIAHDTLRGLQSSFAHGNADLFAELGWKDAIIRAGINHAVKEERQPTAPVFEDRLN